MSSMQIDHVKSIREGAIGGIGAIPGTFCSHFCDVIKMRQQLTGERWTSAIRGIYNNQQGRRRAGGGSTNKTNQQHTRSITNFFAGAMAAIQQKIATRSTMFLSSSVSIQFFQQYLNFSPTSSAFIGSATSGYITGYIASPWEWQKVLVSQRVPSPVAGKGVFALFIEATKCHGHIGGMKCMSKRMHGAGIRNAIFDSTFFGVKHMLEDMKNTNNNNSKIVSLLSSSGYAYGIAAITAVSVDYAIDVSVKRAYGTGPECSIPSMGVIRHTIHIVSKNGLRIIYRGLGIKCVEFGISYMITGMMAPYVTRMMDDVLFVSK